MQLTSSIILKYLKDYKNKSNDEKSSVLETITSLIVLLMHKNEQFYYLSKILPEKQLQDLVLFFDGGNLKLPTKEEYLHLTLVVVVFYMAYFDGYSETKIFRTLKTVIDNEYISIKKLRNDYRMLHYYINKADKDFVGNLCKDEITEMLNDVHQAISEVKTKTT